MVTATQDPYTLRVSFFCHETPLSRSDIVCNVRAAEDGLEIEYLYHDQQMRAISGSAWQPPQEAQMKLTPILMAEIEIGVMRELWATFKRRIRIMEMK